MFYSLTKHGILDILTIKNIKSMQTLNGKTTFQSTFLLNFLPK